MLNRIQTGRNIDEIRKARKMSIEKLAKAINTSYSTVKHHIDNGITSIDMLLRYAEALGCEPADLLDGSYDLENFTLEESIISFYPFNLAAEVASGAYVSFSKESKERQKEIIEQAYKVYVPALLESLKTLTEREQKVLDLRFVHGLTYEQCGYRFNVTRERIRQIEAKAIRKLRHPSRSKKWYKDTIDKAFEIDAERARLERENEELKQRLEALGEKIERDAKQEENRLKSTDIAYMDLSVRSYNCLKRAGINTLDDLSQMNYEKLTKVRNLGRKSLGEVISKAKEFGIEIPWEEVQTRDGKTRVAVYRLEEESPSI